MFTIDPFVLLEKAMKRDLSGAFILVNFLPQVIGEKYLMEIQEGNVTDKYIVELESGSTNKNLDYSQKYQLGESCLCTNVAPSTKNNFREAQDIERTIIEIALPTLSFRR